MYCRQRPRKIRDEDFLIFKNEVSKILQSYKTSSDDTKIIIKNQIFDAIQNCKRHIGEDLMYHTDMDVCRRFHSFYSPRLRLLTNAYDQLV